MTIIDLPFEAPPLTKNAVRLMHHHKEAKIRRESMEAVRWAIRAAKVQPLDAAVVILHWRQPDRRVRDGDGADPTKAICLDALVLEGVLPDDSWRFVRHSGITCHSPIKGKPGALWLSIEAVA